jgi:hypothetical protein
VLLLHGTTRHRAELIVKNFPNEGGPAIVAIDLPDDLAEAIIGGVGELVEHKAFHTGTEIRFDPGGGLEELLTAWPELSKTISLLKDPKS